MEEKKLKFLVIHGPNLNLLGRREPDIYGSLTIDDLNKKISDYANSKNVLIQAIQSNREGDIIDYLQESENEFDGVILNPGGYTHTSIAIRDAVSAMTKPVVEIHISNIYAREEFRSRSVISSVTKGIISGFGPYSYLLGVEALILILKGK
jgi:3-dehydroquinate dehydratase II